jgi:hypothetical protein
MLGELIATGDTYNIGRIAINNAFSSTTSFESLSATTFFSGASPLDTIILNLTSSIWSAGTGTSSAALVNTGSIASGNYAVAEGFDTQAVGNNSHAEGLFSMATGSSSHAEGSNTKSLGASAHAEGVACIASGSGAHAEGFITQANGDYSHAEGRTSQANAIYSHAEGHTSLALGIASHTQNSSNTSSGVSSHAAGTTSFANGDFSFVHSNSSSANSISSAILGGVGNIIPTGFDNSVILGMSGFTATASGTTYMSYAYVDSYIDLNPQNNLPPAQIGRLFFSGSPLNRLMQNTGGTASDWIIV